MQHRDPGATDVTGFGLLGHGLEMARASGTRFVFEADVLPALAGALALAARGSRNRRSGTQPAIRRGLADARFRRRSRTGRARARPSDIGRSARRRSRRRTRPLSQAALDDRGIEHWWIGEVAEGDASGEGGVIEASLKTYERRPSAMCGGDSLQWSGRGRGAAAWCRAVEAPDAPLHRGGRHRRPPPVLHRAAAGRVLGVPAVPVRDP